MIREESKSLWFRGRLVHAFVPILLAVVGCEKDSAEVTADVPETVGQDVPGSDVQTDNSGTETTGSEVDVQGDLSPFVVGEWEAVEPGGETLCSDGSPFRFFVRRGDPKKAMVFMQGGGACWNLMTCVMGPAMSRPDVPTMEQFQEDLAKKTSAGVLDLGNPKHPFPDWTVVYIPYCSSDLHWGRGDHVYSSQLTVPHRGFFNASAALEWMYDYVKGPEMLVLTGSSAGGYGMLLHSAWVSKHYPEATIRVVVDAAAGIVAGDFTAVSMEVWSAAESMPTFIPEIAEKDLSALTFPELYGAIARHFPQHRYSLYSTAWDDQQTFFYKVMGGVPEQWHVELQETITTMTGELPQLSIFVPAGTMHTILSFEAFYERQEGGVLFSDWMTQFALGDSVPANVNCTEEECSTDPICEACPSAEEGPRPFHCDVCESMGNLD